MRFVKLFSFSVLCFMCCYLFLSAEGENSLGLNFKDGEEFDQEYDYCKCSTTNKRQFNCKIHFQASMAGQYVVLKAMPYTFSCVSEAVEQKFKIILPEEGKKTIDENALELVFDQNGEMVEIKNKERCSNYFIEQLLNNSVLVVEQGSIAYSSIHSSIKTQVDKLAAEIIFKMINVVDMFRLKATFVEDFLFIENDPKLDQSEILINDGEDHTLTLHTIMDSQENEDNSEHTICNAKLMLDRRTGWVHYGVIDEKISNVSCPELPIDSQSCIITKKL